jgi:hypothetical protein
MIPLIQDLPIPLHLDENKVLTEKVILELEDQILLFKDGNMEKFDVLDYECSLAEIKRKDVPGINSKIGNWKIWNRIPYFSSFKEKFLVMLLFRKQHSIKTRTTFGEVGQLIKNLPRVLNPWRVNDFKTPK